MFINKFVNNSRKQGYALLVAILTMSLVTAVGFSILSISLKGFRLSVSERESVYAFYAADSGAECALLWDIRGLEINGIPTFATSTDTFNNYTGWYDMAGFNPTCLEKNIAWGDDGNYDNSTGDDWRVVDLPSKATTKFWLDFAEGYCAEINVKKEVPVWDSSRASTTIVSNGYNSSCIDVKSSNTEITVQRTIKVNY